MRRAVGLLVLLVVAAGCSGSAADTTTSTTVPAVELEPIATDRLLAELGLESLVETTAGLRELTFARPVQIAILDDEDYRIRVDDLLAPPLDIDADQADSWLRLLGVMPDGSNQYSATSELLQHGIAINDPATDRVLVRAGAGVDPYVESVVVHELVHLLHAQVFGAPSPTLLAGERSYVYAAIVEGDARRITQRFIGTFGSDDEFRYELGLQAASEESIAARGATPAYVINRLRRVTDDGVRFLQGLTNEDVDRVLEAVADPSALGISSEALVVTGADLEVLPITVPSFTMPSYQQLPLDDTLGAGPLRLLLEGAVPGDVLNEAVAGWGGDSLRVLATTDDVIVAYAYRGETPADAQELAAAFRVLLEAQLAEETYGSIRVTDDEVLVVAASDPSVESRLDELFVDFGEPVFLVRPV